MSDVSEDIETLAVIRKDGVPYYREGVLFGSILEAKANGGIALDDSNPNLWERAVVQYQTRPRIVEAIRVSEHNLEEVAEWCGGRVSSGEGLPLSSIAFPTFDGVAQALEGDYILKHPEGGFEKMNPQDFVNKYELR